MQASLSEKADTSVEDERLKRENEKLQSEAQDLQEQLRASRLEVADLQNSKQSQVQL